MESHRYVSQSVLDLTNPQVDSSTLGDFFSQSGFMPHGHCYLWKPPLIWTHFVSDTLIGLAYLSISITLYLLVRKIRLPYSFVVICFGVFIGACGLTHFMEVWTLWHPDYWLSGGVKVVTAMASLGTGIYLFKLRHPIVTVAEAAKLSEQRRLDLEALTKSLETRVQERTEDLQRSQAELLEVTNSLPSIVTYVDLDHHYRLVNEEFESWLGIKKESAIGKHVQDVLGETAYMKIKPFLERASQGEKIRFETEIEYPQVGRKYVQINYVPKFKDGSIDGVIALIIDQTAERTHQARARELALEAERERAQLTAVLNAVSDGITVTDMQGQFIYFNEAEAQMNGFPDTESMKKNLDSFSQVYELRKGDGQKLDTKDWPVSRVLRGETLSNLEIYAKRTDTGQEWCFSFSGQPVIDHTGKQFLAVVVKRDVTIQKRNEQAQIESLEQFKTMANSISQLAWMADSSGSIFWYNDSWYQYTGTTPDEMAGWGWQMVHDPRELPKVMENWNKCIQLGCDFEMEFPLRSGNGSYRHFLTRARPIRDAQGRIIRWFGTNTDIEDQRKTREYLKRAKDEAEMANQSKSRFIANMSHELRTPMTAVLGFTELLKEAYIPEDQRQDALERIDRSGKVLLRLIDDLLDISKIEAGKIEIEKVNFSPIEAATEVISLLKIRAEENHSTIRFHFDPTVPEIACSDPNRLRQILTNIIGNAVKFTKQGNVTVTLKGQTKDQTQKQFLIFEISDTGIGINNEDQKKIFQPFTQADPSITRKFGGTGLGLVLSKRLASELGGDLELVHSEIGKGSCFRLEIEAGPFQYLLDEASTPNKS